MVKPDLNPTEHAFHMLKKIKGTSPCTKQELEVAVVGTWLKAVIACKAKHYMQQCIMYKCIKRFEFWKSERCTLIISEFINLKFYPEEQRRKKKGKCVFVPYIIKGSVKAKIFLWRCIKTLTCSRKHGPISLRWGSSVLYCFSRSRTNAI